MEEDEKENLRKAEERLKTCAAEAAFAADMGAQLQHQQAAAAAAKQEPDEAAAAGASEGGAAEPEQAPAPAPAAEEGTHLAALQERQREAEEKVARLKRLAAGPVIPPVRPISFARLQVACSGLASCLLHCMH